MSAPNSMPRTSMIQAWRVGLMRSAANFYAGEAPYPEAVYNDRIERLLRRIERRAYARPRPAVTKVEYRRAERLFQALRKDGAYVLA